MEVGDPAGHPVVYCHGTPTSRLDALGLDGAARRAGVRLIAPDRPGIGLSGPRPPWRVGDWPADAAALADALEVERFATLGWSGGGPYALACAWALRDRVPRVLVVAGSAPAQAWGPLRAALRRGPGPRTMSLADRMVEALARRALPLARAELALAAAAARLWPALARRVLGHGLPPAEREALRRAPGFADLAFFLEAFRGGALGPALDYRALGSPWGFRPEDVAAPVELWQGDDDRVVPAAHAQHLAARLPRARLHRLPGEGHLALLTRADEVLARARGELRP